MFGMNINNSVIMSGSGKTIVNGIVYNVPAGASISISNGKVIINGKDVTKDHADAKVLNITIQGDVAKANADNLTVEGNVTSAEVGNNLIIKGNVTGNCRAGNNINANKIIGECFAGNNIYK